MLCSKNNFKDMWEVNLSLSLEVVGKALPTLLKGIPKCFFTSIRLDTRPMTGVCENFNQSDKFPAGSICPFGMLHVPTHPRTPSRVHPARYSILHMVLLSLSYPPSGSENVMRNVAGRHFPRYTTSQHHHHWSLEKCCIIDLFAYSSHQFSDYVPWHNPWELHQ